jgi:hypothetical protein
VPIALAEFLDTEPVARGENLLLLAFGGGLTWASALVRLVSLETALTERKERKKEEGKKNGALLRSV